jgi:hypothetical protein
LIFYQGSSSRISEANKASRWAKGDDVRPNKLHLIIQSNADVIGKECCCGNWIAESSDETVRKRGKTMAEQYEQFSA